MRTVTRTLAVFGIAALSLVVTNCKAPVMPAKPSPAPSPAAPVNAQKTSTKASVQTAPAPIVEVSPAGIARQLCAAALRTPAMLARRCCKRKDKLPSTTTCEASLLAPLQSKTVRADGLKRCLQDYETALGGCDWVGGETPLPLSCRGVLAGTVGADSKCTSTLECKTGVCSGGTCVVTSGNACGGPIGAFGNEGCVAGERCEDGACARACPVPCHEHERCVDDKCVALQAPGQPCDGDATCVGACIEGLCAMRCGAPR